MPSPSGLGEQHLDVLVSKLKNKFGVSVSLEVPRVAYRETIRKKVKVQGKHKKQSGGHGQFGDVWIEFEPTVGDGLVFEEKVFGGAVEAGQKVTAHEYTVAQKNELNCDAKRKIAEYAASLIEPDDFVFLDAGTTTAHMIDFIRATSAVFVTNAVDHARRLASRGFKVILVGGELMKVTFWLPRPT